MFSSFCNILTICTCSLQMPFLKTKEKLKFIFTRYYHYLQHIKTMYEKEKEDPCTARNMPIFSGRISWARQLFMKVEQPMDVFKKSPWLFKLVSMHFVSKPVKLCYQHVTDNIVFYLPSV